MVIMYPMTYEETIMYRWTFSAAMVVWVPYFIWLFSNPSRESKNEGKILAGVAVFSLLLAAAAFALHSNGVI